MPDWRPAEPRPSRAGGLLEGRAPMEIILHVGTHRTGTTGFQAYLRAQAPRLEYRRIGFWEPTRTRKGLLSGIVPVPGGPDPAEQMRAARQRIEFELMRTRHKRLARLVVSDENMLGMPRQNLRERRLYPEAGERLARYLRAFNGRVTRVALSIRPQDEYWRSLLTLAVIRGRAVPGRAEIAALAQSGQGWRGVIEALAQALPGVEIRVFPHADFVARPDRLLMGMTGAPALPAGAMRTPVNASPGLEKLRKIAALRGVDVTALPRARTRWEPFGEIQARVMREAYEDDLFWLRAGADGKATLIEENRMEERGANPAAIQKARGHGNGIEERRLA
ncbi:MAG: hypothetical protein RIG84_16205 [Roseovarius sp.]